MIRLIRNAALSILAMSFIAQASAANWEEGTHYQVLDTPVRTASESGIEVAEVFWYGCPHCYTFKPLVESWAEDLPENSCGPRPLLGTPCQGLLRAGSHGRTGQGS